MSSAALPSFASVSSASSLSILYQNLSNNTIWISASTDGTNWQSPAQLPAWLTSSCAPSATVWNGAIFVMGASKGSQETLQVANINAWNSVVQLPPAITTNINPVLVANGNELWAVFRSSSGDNTLFVTQSSDATSWNLNHLPPAITTSSAPAAAAIGGYVYVLFRSSADATLFVTKSNDGVNWDLHQLPVAITSGSSPALTAMNGTLYAVFMSSADDAIFISKSSDGVNWDLNQLPGAATTQAAPTIMAMNGQLYVLYQSSVDSSVWQTSSSDGVNWSSVVQLPDTIAVGPGTGPPDTPDQQSPEEVARDLAVILTAILG